MHLSVSSTHRFLEEAQTKRELNTEERYLIKQLKKELDDAEKAITKEIRAIEK